MASDAELACVYSALILADDEVPITADKLNTILKAANVEVEPYWPTLFARALSGMNVKDLITNIGSATAAGGGAPTAAPAAGAAKEEVKEEKKEEKKEESEESDDDMGFGLFD